MSSRGVWLELGPNEFTDEVDHLGLFRKSDPEPYTFLSIESQTEGTKTVEYPYATIILSPIKHTYERATFTLMMLLGELGGLYGAIIGIPSYFISYFTANLFKSALTGLVPLKNSSSSDSAQYIQQKLSCESNYLTREDVERLANEALKFEKMSRVSLLRKLCPCLKSKAQKRMHEQAFKEL